MAVISESIARAFFPNENPIGKRIMQGSFDNDEPPWTVVGVVSDMKENSLASTPSGVVYRPLEQVPVNFAALSVRSPIPPRPRARFAATCEGVAAFYRDLPLATQAMLDDRRARSPGAVHDFGSRVALVALLLAVIGVTACRLSVAHLSHEIGILCHSAHSAPTSSRRCRRVLGTAAGVRSASSRCRPRAVPD